MRENKLYKIEPTLNRPKAGEYVKKLIKNPNSHYVIFGLIIALMQILSMASKGAIISTTLMTTVRNIMIYTIMSLGYCFLLGYSGLASLGTAGFVGVGSYITFFLMRSGVPLSITLIVVIIAGIIFGAAIGFLSLRISGMYLALVTLGLSEVMRYALKAIYSNTIMLKNSNIRLLGIEVDKKIMFFVVLAILVVLMIFINNLVHSPTGRATVAMKDSSSASQAFGISMMKYRLLPFIIATIFAMIGGFAYTLSGNSITPTSEAETMLKLTLSLNILGAVIIGGYKSIFGAFVGSFLVFGLSDLFVVFIQDNALLNKIFPYVSLVVGALIILIVMFYPGGLAQLANSGKNLVKKLYKKVKEARYGKVL